MDDRLKPLLRRGPGGEDLGEEGVFGGLDASVEGGFGVTRKNGDTGLGEDAAGIDLGDDKVDSAAGAGFTGGEGVAHGVAAFELGK